MDKKLKDLTIGEIFEMCCSDSSCVGCPFYKKGLIKNDNGFCMNFIDVFHLKKLDEEVENNE